MPAIPLRQRSATEIVDAAFQIFRREPAQFIVATAIIYVPWLLIQLAIGDRSPAAVATFSATNAMVSFIVAIGAVVVSSLVAAVCTALASDYYLGAPTDLPQAFQRVLPRVGTLALAQLLWSLLFVIGLICFIIPGFYVLARFFAVPQVIVLEGSDIGGAFSRSTVLSTDNKRHVLGTLLLAGVIMIAISMGWDPLESTCRHASLSIL